MFHSSRVVQTLGRRALTKSLRTNIVSQQAGAIRLSSYFTPGKQCLWRRQRRVRRRIVPISFVPFHPSVLKFSDKFLTFFPCSS